MDANYWSKEVKKEAFEEYQQQEQQVNEEYSRQKLQEPEKEEPTSEFEQGYQVTIQQFVISKEKPMNHSSSSSSSMEEMPLETYKSRLRSKRCRPFSLFENDCVIPERTRRTRSKGIKAFSGNGMLEVSPDSVMERAKEVQANLDPQFPSFIKPMLHSHVTKGFWLHLPVDFSKRHISRRDEIIVLEDESGKEYKIKYLAAKAGLSGGWRAFALAQNLLEGDIAVFHLLNSNKFKVYIVRASGLGEVDGALGLLNLENYYSRRHSDKKLRKEEDVTLNKVEEYHLEPVPNSMFDRSIQQYLPADTNSSLLDVLETGRDNPVLKNASRFDHSGTFVDFQNFNIIVNDFILDTKLSKNQLIKYYELCRGQKSYLHDRLLKSINSSLAAGIISETVKIADAIKSCKISTSQDDFELWDKTIAGLELLGMEVGFLRTRLNKLVKLAIESGEKPELKRYREARLEHNLAEEEIKTLETKLLKLQQVKTKLHFEIEALNMNIHEYELRFIEEASAPW